MQKTTHFCRKKQHLVEWSLVPLGLLSPGPVIALDLNRFVACPLHIPSPLYIHFYFLYSEIPPLSSESFSPSAPLCHSPSLTVCCLDCFFLHLLSSVIYEHIDAIWWTPRSGVIHGTVAQEHWVWAWVGPAGVKGSNPEIVCSLLCSLRCTDYCCHYPA